ncbi:MAG: hypothetical protein Q7U10_08895 [Thermodesulfovibrionia bacterium]|nr:hypothetical protein [Thermodesulfovibrionia bacterium]
MKKFKNITLFLTSLMLCVYNFSIESLRAFSGLRSASTERRFLVFTGKFSRSVPLTARRGRFSKAAITLWDFLLPGNIETLRRRMTKKRRKAVPAAKRLSKCIRDIFWKLDHAEIVNIRQNIPRKSSETLFPLKLILDGLVRADLIETACYLNNLPNKNSGKVVDFRQWVSTHKRELRRAQ